ncbi:PREDICTED: uncharacterized protein LOC109115816 [Nelumbo nucifera]|uniref:Uncharacterized protein LOC109115816 n=1 Tax=Nelumbo nucifera TaxID=4432 RepID=A0A1U8QC49_NELNU|nr:PREDICTED: uncharacterized protein LOC109115816 [Nelumbo nucifera]
MHECKASNTPMVASTKLTSFCGTLVPNITEYRSVVGALQYVTLTRPEIAYSINKVCQFLAKPTTNHLSTVKRILRYLKSTIDHGLLIRPTKSFSLETFSDADWAGCTEDHRSHGGFCIYLGSNLVSWSSRKQQIVSWSITKSEYKSIAIAVAEISWVQMLLTELGFSSSSPPTLWCDNLGATYLSANLVSHA